MLYMLKIPYSSLLFVFLQTYELGIHGANLIFEDFKISFNSVTILSLFSVSLLFALPQFFKSPKLQKKNTLLFHTLYLYILNHTYTQDIIYYNQPNHPQVLDTLCGNYLIK